MAPPDAAAVTELLTKPSFRILPGEKQLTLAFGGIYIASTTLTAKPLLVWETENSYPRYYIPVESLHADIQSRVSELPINGTVPVELAALEWLDEGGASAVIERLTVGGKTTTWVRFLGGSLKGYIRFERNEIDDWFENGSLFAGIKNPYKRIDTYPVAHHIVVKVDGEVVAETNVAVLLNETNIGGTYYLPATSIKNWGAVEKSSLRTACPYKGEAWYLSLTVKGKKHEDLVWYYQYPTHESAGVQGLISFYKKDFVEILVDGAKL